MSEDVSKTAIRVILPELDGKNWNDVYPYFLEKLGKPDDIDEFEDVIEHFSYDEYDVINDDKDGVRRWAVDLILEKEDSPDFGGLNASVDYLLKLASDFSAKFDKSNKDCRVVSYSWYNGCDEPVILWFD